MTRIPTDTIRNAPGAVPPGTRVRRRRASALAVSMAALAVVTLHDASPVDASARTNSDAIATEAGEALEAFGEWELSGEPADYVRFIQGRDQAAAMTARDLGTDPRVLAAAWSRTDPGKQRVILFALTQLGVPYRSMKSEAGVGFDCSGLTSWAYRAAGVEIPRVSGDQIRKAVRVEAATAEAGDLVYYPGHVSMYLGAGTMVHSPYSGSDVEATYLPERSLRYGDILAAVAPAD